MTRTLAELVEAGNNPQKYIGMWCDNLASAAQEPALVVLACVQGETCWILHTGIHGERSGFPLESVAPRFDLPRAWNPDGTPVKGKWENTRTPDNPHDPLLRRRFISEYEDRTND